jgi:hypothetical protein
MPKLKNIVTGVVKDLPARYVGLYPYELAEAEAAELRQPVVVEVEEVAKPSKKKKAEYNHPAVDADGDGLVQDGTVYERPAGTELSPEELTAIENELSE